MATQVQDFDEHRTAALASWLDRPLSRLWCVIGWLTSSALFVGIIAMLGGPSESDANEFVYSTWAIAHGHLACAYSPGTVLNLPGISKPGPFIAPLYPLLSGAVAALLRIGHSIP